MKELMTITEKELASMIIPKPEWIMIKVDVPMDRSGNIILIKDTREKQQRWVPTGIVISRPLTNYAETDVDQERLKLIKIGDRVGFNPSNIIASPIPPFIKVKDENKVESSKFEELNDIDPVYIFLHVSDIVADIAITTEEKNKIIEKMSK